MSSSRRRFLVTVTAAGTAVLAGCQDDQTGDDTGQESNGQNGMEEVNWILENPDDGQTFETENEEYPVTFEAKVETNEEQFTPIISINGELVEYQDGENIIELERPLETGEYEWKALADMPGETTVESELREFSIEQIVEQMGIRPGENQAIREEYDASSLDESHSIFDFDLEDHVDTDISAPIDLEAMRYFHDHNTKIATESLPKMELVAKAVTGEITTTDRPHMLNSLESNYPFVPFEDRIRGRGTQGRWDHETVQEADSEYELLGWIHPATHNALSSQYEVVPDWDTNAEGQMAAIQLATDRHPNDELNIHSFVTPLDGRGNLGMAYCESTDTLRIVETSDFAETSVPKTDHRQLHPKVENSNYFPEADPIEQEDQTDQYVGIKYHSDVEKGNEEYAYGGLWIESTILNTSILPNNSGDRKSIQERGYQIQLQPNRIEGRNIAMTKGLAEDASESLREYNSNSVDFEDDIYSLGRLMDELIRFHDDENWVIDYQPGNSYDGELNGEYTAIPVDEETLENVKQDETREYDHFLEQHSDKIS